MLVHLQWVMDGGILELPELHHVNSSTSSEGHESKWPVNWKNRVNFIVTYMYLICIKSTYVHQRKCVFYKLSLVLVCI